MINRHAVQNKCAHTICCIGIKQKVVGLQSQTTGLKPIISRDAEFM